jgi:hypothetical protein
VFSGDARAQEIFDFAENEAVIEEVMKRVPSSVAAISMSQKAAAGSFLRWPERLGGGHALLN